MADNCRVLTQVPQICSAISTFVPLIPFNFILYSLKNKQTKQPPRALHNLLMKGANDAYENKDVQKNRLPNKTVSAAKWVIDIVHWRPDGSQVT